MAGAYLLSVSPNMERLCYDYRTARIARITQLRQPGVSLPPIMTKSPSAYSFVAFMILAFCLLCHRSVLQAGSLSFNYTAPTAGTTSAGVYAADGTLLHTLWSNEATPAGVNIGVWDGRDDDGLPMSPGTYTIKVLHSQISYTWEGTIGNTSIAQTGPTARRAFYPTYDVAIKDSNMFFAVGYNEQGGLFHRSSTATPNVVDYYGPGDKDCSFSQAATDGTRVYFGSRTSVSNFVTAFNISDNTRVLFSNGVSPANTWTKIIDFTTGYGTGPAGIAVQTSGNYLFVAHASLNEIHVFDKLSGAAVSTASITAPGRIVLTADESGLWAICTEGTSRVVRRYSIDGSGNLALASPVITGLSSPLALAIAPDNNTLLVADGGTSQQVKAYDNPSTGSPSLLWTLGQAGGYDSINGPAVANDKFCFSINTDDQAIKNSCLAFQSDGSFWVGDAGNERILHFSAARAYINQIMYLSHNYVSEVCLGNPTRVFARGWLEFAVDYSMPIQQSWTLVKNWTAGIPEVDIKAHMSGFQTVKTMSNGRTYGVANKKVYELMDTGLRYTGITLTSQENMHDNGDLRWAAVSSNSTFVTYYQRQLTGFDASNNPTWSASTVLATSPTTSTSPLTNTGGRGSKGVLHPSTSTGLMIVSDTRGDGIYSYHLGAIAEGGNTWKWKTARAGLYFDGHGSVGAYCWKVGNNAYVADRHIIYGAHGEGYYGHQAGQFLHYWDNGLMLGELGTPLDNIGAPLSAGIVAGQNGNSFSPRLIRVGSALYFWVNDEFSTSGLQRWKINNPDSPTEINVTVNLPSGSNGTGLTGQYFSDAGFATPVSQGTDTSVNFNWGSGSPAGLPIDNFGIRWSGLIEPRFSETYTFTLSKQSDDQVRLWINESLVADGWNTVGTTVTGSVALTAGQKYPILLEYADGTGTASIALKWQSPGQALQVIPMNQLYPSDAHAYNMGGISVGRWQEDPLGIPVASLVSTSRAITTTGIFDGPPGVVYQKARQAGGIDIAFKDLQPSTNYRVRSHLAEIHSSYQGVGARKFKITAPTPNAEADIRNGIDIFALAGVGYKAIVLEHTFTTDPSGHARIGYGSDPQKALVNAIEILRDGSSNSAFTMVGAGTGLKGEYFAGTSFNTLTVSRIDPEMNFSWPSGTAPAPGMPSTNYTVRWTGQLQSAEGGSYTFNLLHDDGVRLWINDVLLIDQWATSGTHTGIIALAASTRYNIKIEYLQNSAAADMTLKWIRPNGPLNLIPRSQFYPSAYPVPEVIVDNTNATGVIKTGTWTSSTAASGQYYGSDYIHDGDTGKGAKSVRFTPTLPLTGSYEVFIRQTSSANRAAAVPTTITHPAGTASFVVNHQVNGGEWVSFGTYHFNAGATGYVTISNTGTTGYVIADAVKFVKR